MSARINPRHPRRSTRSNRTLRWYSATFGTMALMALRADAHGLAAGGHRGAAARLVAARQYQNRKPRTT